MAAPQHSFLKEVKEAFVFQWNARGLKSRISDFRPFVFKNKFPIIVICEPNIESAIRLSGYEAFMSGTCSDRSKVIVYVRCDFTYVLHPVAPDDENQYVCLTVKCKNVKLTLVGAYISPSRRFNNARLSAILKATPGPWIITGDFNAHHPLWGSLKMDSRGRRVLSFASNHELCCLNDGSPTFLRGLTYSSCLDLTFVSRSFSSSVKWFPDNETHGSDHVPTYVKVEGIGKSHCTTVKRIDWPKYTLLMEQMCQRTQNCLPGNIEELINDAAQKATSMFRPIPKFSEFEAELERLRAIRRRAERRYRRTKSIYDLREARRMQKKIKRRINLLQSLRWKSFCDSLDPHKPLSHIWRTVRGLRTSPQQHRPFKCLALYQGRREIDVADDFCSKVAGQSSSSTAHDPYDVPISRDSRMDNLFSVEELQAALAVCRRSSSPGPDGVTYAALANLGQTARHALLDVYNNSWREGVVPAAWKSSRLVPLLKPGKSPLDVASYRPIALASCLGKVMERMVLTRLEWYLEQYEIYPDAMAGFRRGRSSIDNVIDLVSSVQHEKSLRRLSAAMFLDVKGAYDNVTHRAILDALGDVGLGGLVFRWIYSYLKDRSFFVQTEDGVTSQHYTYRGVPQGGVLSPTLFNLVLIDLVHSLPQSVHVSIYADDICIWSSAVTRPQVRARLQKAATATSGYLRARGLEVSSEKCSMVAFTRKAMTPYIVRINGQPIIYEKTHRFLGVIIDRDLSWSPHVSYLKRSYPW